MVFSPVLDLGSVTEARVWDKRQQKSARWALFDIDADGLRAEFVEIDSVKCSEVLFIPRGNPRMAAVFGKTISMAYVQNQLGFKVVKAYGDFGKIVGKFLTGRKELLYSFPVEFLYDAVSNQRYFIAQKAKKSFKEKFDGLKVKSPNKILASLRQTVTGFNNCASTPPNK